MIKLITKIDLRKNARIDSNKNERRIHKRVIHVQASFNNTNVIVIDVRGRVVSWAYTGTSGFRGTWKGTSYAAQATAFHVIHTLVDESMQQAEVMIKGPGHGRDATLRAIRRNGMLLSFVRDVTPMPHNGCRVVSWAYIGTSGFRGTWKGTPYAAQAKTFHVIHTLVDQSMQQAEVMIKGLGHERDATLRAIRRNGMLLSFVRDNFINLKKAKN